ncbi:MAG TPA: hypothetical protein VF230_07350 [Acidimicrobiales bacterium]
MGGPRHRPHVRRVATVVAAALAVSTLTACWNRDDDDDAGAGAPLRFEGRVIEGAPDLAFDALPASYEVTYAIDDVSGGTRERRFELVVVDRPWASRLEGIRRPGRPAVTAEVGTFGRRSIGVDDALVLAMPPSLAPADVRIDAAVDDASARGLLLRREVRETRLAAGRCQVFRSADGLAASPLAPMDAGAKSYVESCIDERGIVVEELEVVDGKVVKHKLLERAIADDVDDADRARLRVDGTPIEVRSGGGSILPLTPESRLPNGMWELPAGEPSGWTRKGRFSVIPPQPENFTDPTREGARVSGVADVWERGIDVLLVEQGATLRAVDPFPPIGEGAETIDLGPLGTAEVIVSLRMSELRVRRRGGAYVRVIGTLAVTELEAVARALAEQPGGELVFVDD